MISLMEIGLIFDLVGAMILARAIAFERTRMLVEKSSTFWRMNLFLLYGLCEQRVDTRFGIAFLFSGFLIQIIGQNTSASSGGGKLLLISALFLSGLVYFLSREIIAQSDFVTAKQLGDQDDNT